MVLYEHRKGGDHICKTLLQYSNIRTSESGSYSSLIQPLHQPISLMMVDGDLTPNHSSSSFSVQDMNDVSWSVSISFGIPETAPAPLSLQKRGTAALLLGIGLHNPPELVQSDNRVHSGEMAR